MRVQYERDPKRARKGNGSFCHQLLPAWIVKKVETFCPSSPRTPILFVFTSLARKITRLATRFRRCMEYFWKACDAPNKSLASWMKVLWEKTFAGKPTKLPHCVFPYSSMDARMDEDSKATGRLTQN